MEYAAAALAPEFDVYTYGFADSRPIWELKQADVLVLPYLSLAGEYLNAPLLSQKIPAVSTLDMLRYGGILFGGGLGDSFKSYCYERAAKVFDFFDDEDLTLRNADLTAEGALEIVLRETEVSAADSNVRVYGFGRVAKACAKTFAALGARVTVAARSASARDEAAKLGYSVCETGEITGLNEADTVINTVPHRIIGKDELLAMKRDVFLLDLASAPYGVDFEAARQLKIKAATAPGLPGKTAPKTAGGLIAESVIKRIREVGGLAEH